MIPDQYFVLLGPSPLPPAKHPPRQPERGGDNGGTGSQAGDEKRSTEADKKSVVDQVQHWLVLWLNCLVITCLSRMSQTS